ncbi:hypothetical protein DXX93_18550 [Thalassotalea euphylliae]|uniref:Solute-binding protein family 3/N-terminal domain-containing protein n=1 Tax=Thalassotalea euphylliae TaxID=1655234 RepID=A0A3E0TUL4_9GAMM|nr:transporter substrate-binding domain-containing protein [Thalassotalea euphylliae]REL28366.1 hypothetical protein DXX93_18550 [Thalassotalea euphylliae]
MNLAVNHRFFLTFIRHAALCTGLFMPVLSCGLTYAQPIQMTVCIDDQLYIPYFDKDERMGDDGKVIELIQWSAEQNNLVLKVLRKSWPRCLAEIASDKVDAIMAAIYTPERAELMAFPDGAAQANPDIYLLRLRYPFFVRKGSDFRLRDYQRQSGFGINAPREYIAHQMLAHMELLSAYDYTLENGLKMVAAGRLDAYVVESASGHYAVERLALEQQLQATSEILMERYTHIPVSRQFYRHYKPQVDSFWRDLATARARVLADVD